MRLAFKEPEDAKVDHDLAKSLQAAGCCVIDVEDSYVPCEVLLPLGSMQGPAKLHQSKPRHIAHK